MGDNIVIFILNESNCADAKTRNSVCINVTNILCSLCVNVVIYATVILKVKVCSIRARFYPIWAASVV